MGGLSRKLKREHTRQAKKILSIESEKAKSESQKIFDIALDNLAVVGEFSNHLSVTETGFPTTVSGELASIVFAKMCAHARSIGALAISSMFDHSAIVSVARMIVEGATACSYFMQPVSEPEWAFRHLVMRLHDTVARIKFLRSFPTPTDDLRVEKEQLIAEICMSTEFHDLDVNQQKRISSGDEIFVGGMRRAAQSGVGWDPERLTSIYAYFSAHTHTAPMSFMRTRQFDIDYYFPSDPQLEIAAFAIEVAIACLKRIALRRLDELPELADRFPESLVGEFRREDAASTVFSASAPLTPASIAVPFGA